MIWHSVFNGCKVKVSIPTRKHGRLFVVVGVSNAMGEAAGKKFY
jgi:hypothetical protein